MKSQISVAERHRSKKTGRIIIRLTHCDADGRDFYTEWICHGYQGFAGEKAAARLKELLGRDVYPGEDIDDLIDELNSTLGGGCVLDLTKERV